MRDSFPNNVFIEDDMQKQIDSIKEYERLFKAKYAEVFEKDIDGNFIEFFWNSLPEFENGKSKISFDIKYSEKLPVEVKNAFQEYIDRFRS